jgi:hypothetical protein
MTANIIWKTMKTYAGMPVSPHISGIQLVPVPKYWVKLPMKRLAPSLSLEPKVRVKP